MKLIPFVTKELEKVFSKSTMLVKLYSAFYKNIVKKEVKLAKINNNDSILFYRGRLHTVYSLTNSFYDRGKCKNN